MPSIRKRIGYLPSINIQEIIIKIATQEKLSQSKVVGILVEEALMARGVINFRNKDHLIRKHRYENRSSNNMDNSSFKYHDLDELISDQGITYNSKEYKRNSDTISSEKGEDYNEELFEQFKQFILFQKMKQEEK